MASPRAVAGDCELGGDEQARTLAGSPDRRPLDAGEIGGHVAANALHLQGSELHHFPSDDMAPSSFGRSPKRATRLKMTAAVVTKRIVTEAMVGV